MKMTSSVSHLVRMQLLALNRTLLIKAFDSLSLIHMLSSLVRLEQDFDSLNLIHHVRIPLFMFNIYFIYISGSYYISSENDF
jgi:hypothetical protein